MKGKLSICAIIICFFLFWAASAIRSEAAEWDRDEVTILVTGEKTDLLSESSEKGMIVMTLESETPVIYRGEEENGWIKIYYQDYDGYARIENFVEYVDWENLEKEFSDLNLYYENGFDRIQQMERERFQKIVWIAVIVIFLVASVVLCIHYIVKNKKSRVEEND